MSDELTKVNINCIKVGQGDNAVYYDFTLPKDAQIDILTASIYRANIYKGKIDNFRSSTASIQSLTAYDTLIYTDKEAATSFQAIGPNIFFTDAVNFEPSYEELNTLAVKAGSYDNIDIFSGFDEEKGISSVPLHIYNNPTEDNKNFAVKLTSSNIECICTKTNTAGKDITLSYNSSWEQILNPNFTEFSTDNDNKIKVTIGDHSYEKEITGVATADTADYADAAGNATTADTATFADTASLAYTASVASTASYSSSTAQNVWFDDINNNNYIKLRVQDGKTGKTTTYEKYISVFPNVMPKELSKDSTTFWDGSGQKIVYYYAELQDFLVSADTRMPLGVIRFQSNNEDVRKSVSTIIVESSGVHTHVVYSFIFSYSKDTMSITLKSAYKTCFYETSTSLATPLMGTDDLLNGDDYYWKIVLCRIQDNYEE